MDKLKPLTRITNVFIILMIFNIPKSLNVDIKMLIISLCALIIINDFIRFHKKKNNIIYFISYFLSLLMAGTICYFYNTFAIPYIYVCLAELIFTSFSIIKTILIFINFITYIVPTTLSIFNDKNFLDNFSSYFFPYIAVLSLMLLIRNVRRERVHIKELNDELTIQNLKLQEYASKVEELTLSAERNRVAQDLHDSLGHYLMAISMHLDILEKTIYTSPDKAINVVKKSKDIVKNSISELRNTVFELKEDKEDKSFALAISELTSNLSTLNELTFNIDINKEIENYTPFLKDVLYKTIKEALTNGIKHGHSKVFNINLSISKTNIILSIKNNGITPSDIIKSNGLKGIEERLSLINAKAEFNKLNPGFEVLVKIPIRKEKTYDKCFTCR